MRKGIKRRLAVFLTIILMTIMLPLLVHSVDYTDTHGHWAETVISKWSKLGILYGNEGQFRPNDSITRAEFSAILNRVIKYTQMRENKFSDVSEEKWYYEDIIKLSTAGILKGSDGKAFPDNKITRQEAAALMARAFDLDIPPDGKTKFIDDEDISSWAKGACAIMASKGYIKGYNNKFSPQNNLTRAEAVQILDNMVKLLINDSEIYSKDIDDGNVVVNTSKATLKNMSVNGDLYLVEGIGEGEVTLDRVNINGNIIVRGGGSNSIKIKDSSVECIIVKKVGSKVRIVSEGDSEILFVEVNGNIILDGNYKQVAVIGDFDIVINGKVEVLIVDNNANITNNGTIGNVEVNAQSTIQNNGTVDTLNASKKVKITGEGEITKASISKEASGSEFDTEPSEIVLAKDTSIIIAGKIVDKIEKETPSGPIWWPDPSGPNDPEEPEEPEVPVEPKESITFFSITDPEVPQLLKDYKAKVIDTGGDYNQIDYTMTYQPSILPVHSVNVTVFDIDKNIWIGTDEGLKCLNIQSGTVREYRDDKYFSDINNNKVDGLYITPELPNFIWVLTGEKVTRLKYRGEGMEPGEEPEEPEIPEEPEETVEFFSITDPEVPQLLKDYKTKVIDTGGDYNQIDYTMTYQPSILPVHSVNVTVFDMDKNIWIGSENGLECLNIQLGTVRDYRDDKYYSKTNNKKVDGLYITPELPDYIWVLTGEKVTKIKYK